MTLFFLVSNIFIERIFILQDILKSNRIVTWESNYNLITTVATALYDLKWSLFQ